MNYQKSPKGAVILLVIGLLIVSLTPIANRYLPMPNFLTGFLTGIGLMIECIALIKMRKDKKQNVCGL